MITIFHGDNQNASRNTFNNFLDTFKGDVLRLDNKQVDLNKINNFLEGSTLFATNKILAITNFFSIPKANLDKLIKIFLQTKTDIAIWQDKKLNATQLKTFNSAKINLFPLPSTLFSCLNQIRPHNLKNFTQKYHETLKTVPFDLLFYMIKNQLKRHNYKKEYLQTIELDYQNKTGKLTIQKEIALERILINLLK